MEDSAAGLSGNDHATALMKAVPTMMQRIAGKSLPIEKFAARKVKRYLAQRNRLVLPGYELMYVWNGFSVLGKCVRACVCLCVCVCVYVCGLVDGCVVCVCGWFVFGL